MKKTPKAKPQRTKAERARCARQGRRKLTQGQVREGVLERYRTFADHYVKTSNGTESAVKAGYSPKTAAAQASRLLRIVKVQEIISELRSELEINRRYSRLDWLRELEALAFSCMADVCSWGPGYVELFPSDQLNEKTQAAISEVKEKTTTIVTKEGAEIIRSHISIKLHDKLQALIKYGTALGYCKGNGEGVLINNAAVSDQNPLIDKALIIIPGKMDLEEWQAMAERMIRGDASTTNQSEIRMVGSSAPQNSGNK